jgi:hypothetical protein
MLKIKAITYVHVPYDVLKSDLIRAIGLQSCPGIKCGGNAAKYIGRLGVLPIRMCRLRKLGIHINTRIG